MAWTCVFLNYIMSDVERLEEIHYDQFHKLQACIQNSKELYKNQK
jgi:hypothetical protein